MRYSRRQILRLAAAALPSAELLRSPGLILGAGPPTVPPTVPLASASSVYGGVQVGVIAPYSFRGMGSNPEDLLKGIVKLGLSAVELQSEGFESWAGAPGGNSGGPPVGPGGGGGPGSPGGRGGPPGGGGPGGFAFNLPGLSEAQRGALREMNESLSGRSQALTAARRELSKATFAAAPDAGDIKRKAEAVAAAELDLAQARSEAFAKLQSSTNKLTDRQVEALIQQGAGAGGRGGGRGSGPGGEPGGGLAAGGSRGGGGQELRAWRCSQSMDKFKELRKMYIDAGVNIELVKFGLGASMSDDEVDYCFQVAKAVGARGITCEPPVSETRRLGQFAEKHQLMIGYHGHSNVSSRESFGRIGAWTQAIFYSTWIGATVDISNFADGIRVQVKELFTLYH